jgi:HK97 family phage major capsid protein
MAYTAIADVIVPEVLADQISAKFPENLVFANTGLVQTDPNFPLGTPGTSFKIPFWKRIGTFGALTEGTAMTPKKVTAAAEYAVVQRAGDAYEVLDTSQLVSMADPMAEISTQIARRAAEYIDNALVAELEKTPNVYDNSANGAGTMTADALMAAMIEKMGDQHQSFLGNGAVVMHSKVYGDLTKLGLIQNVYQSGMDFLKTGIVPTIVGLPIFLSDRCTTAVVSTVTQYNSYIVGPGALSLFYQRQVMVEFDRDILKSSDVVAATVHFAPHLYGWDDVGNALAAEDARSIKAIRVRTK